MKYKVGQDVWDIKKKRFDTVEEIMYESYVLKSDNFEDMLKVNDIIEMIPSEEMLRENPQLKYLQVGTKKELGLFKDAIKQNLIKAFWVRKNDIVMYRYVKELREDDE